MKKLETPKNIFENKVWKNSQGQFHRTDGPAIESVDGYKAWYQNGKLHRTDGPAVEWTHNYKKWFVEGLEYTEEEFNNLSFMTENSYGDKFWENPKGELHRTDGPAVVYAEGDKYWFQNGKRHRTDGPAIEWPDVYQEWYKNGKLHRTDGPAVEYEDGYKAWYVEGVKYTEDQFNNLSFMSEESFGDKVWKNPKGQYHRTDGPAIERKNGRKLWLQNNKFHRTDGPAIDYGNGDKEWWVDNVQYTEEEFNNLSFMSENSYGDKIWKNPKGELHRTDGPAIESVNGEKCWWVNGKRHRTDGPAIEWPDGNKYWWVDNVQYTEEEFNRIMKKNPYKTIVLDGIKYNLVPTD